MSIEQYLGVFLLCALSFYLGTRWAKNEFNEYNKGCLIFRIPLGCNDAQRIVDIIEERVERSKEFFMAAGGTQSKTNDK